jgi:hypothetical protein
MLDFCFAPDLPICVCVSVSVSVCIIITYIHYFQIYIQWFTPSFIIIYTMYVSYSFGMDFYDLYVYICLWSVCIYTYTHMYSFLLIYSCSCLWCLYIYMCVFVSPTSLLFYIYIVHVLKSVHVLIHIGIALLLLYSRFTPAIYNKYA